MLILINREIVLVNIHNDNVFDSNCLKRNFIWSREYTCIPGLDLLLHLNSDLSVVLDHALLVLLTVKVFSASLRGTIFEEDSTVFAVKFLAHLYNRPLDQKYYEVIPSLIWHSEWCIAGKMFQKFCPVWIINKILTAVENWFGIMIVSKYQSSKYL